MKKYFKLEILLFISFNIIFYINSIIEAHHIVFFNSTIKFLLVVNIILFLVKINKKITLLYIISLILLFIIHLTIIIKLISFLALFYISYNLVIKYSSEIRNILVIVLFFNAVFIFIEINGMIPELAYYQIYYTPTNYNTSLFVENSWFPLFQIRPSGIFHSTIYLSFELIFIMAILMYPIKSNFSIILMTFISVFSGSTALFLVIFILILMTARLNSVENISKVIVFMLFWLFLYYFLYPSFFAYNFDYYNYVGSFLSRFDTTARHSSFTSNKYLFQIGTLILILSMVIYIIRNKFKFKLRYLYIGIVLFIIFTIHNFIFTLKFYMNLGLFIGFIDIYHKKYLKERNKNNVNNYNNRKK